MTPDKQAQIRAFTENKVMFDAVREVLLGPSSEHSWLPLIDTRLPNELYGEQVKAHVKAVEFIEHGFAQLKQIAIGKQGVQSTKNEAR